MGCIFIKKQQRQKEITRQKPGGGKTIKIHNGNVLSSDDTNVDLIKLAHALTKLIEYDKATNDNDLKINWEM